MINDRPPIPKHIIFHATTGLDRVFLVRRRKRKASIIWHTWSNGEWSVDEEQHDDLPAAVNSLCNWFRVNLETL